MRIFSQTETNHDFALFCILQTQEYSVNIYDNYPYGDTLTIYDGSNEQLILVVKLSQIAKLSGNLGSFDISSTGNSLFVKFESDGDVTEDGFIATIHYGNPYLNIK